MYRVRRIALVDVPPGERRAAVQLLCRAWSPFEEPEYRVALQRDAALLVAWDRAACSKLGLASERLIPELQFRSPKEEDGCRVLVATEGFEAEFWRNRELVSSRWWRAAPTEDEVRQWLSAHDVAGTRDASIEWHKEPPTLSLGAGGKLLDLTALVQPSGPMERKAALTALIVLCALTGAQGMDWWQSRASATNAKAMLEVARADRAPLMAQRDRALDGLQSVQALQVQFESPSPIRVFKHLAELLPPGVELKEFELKGRVLRLGLTWPSQRPRTELIQMLQGGGWLVSVRELRDASSSNWLTIAAEVDGPTPRVVSAAQAASSPSVGASAGMPPATDGGRR